MCVLYDRYWWASSRQLLSVGFEFGFPGEEVYLELLDGDHAHILGRIESLAQVSNQLGTVVVGAVNDNDTGPAQAPRDCHQRLK